MTEALPGMEEFAVGPRLATDEQVERLLVLGAGSDPDKAREKFKKWSYERAGLTINEWSRRAKLVEQRAKDKAREYDDVEARVREPLPFELEDAAAGIAQALDHGALELASAVSGAVWVMPEDRLRTLAGHLMRVLRGQA
jgi:hypothetical protein